MANCCVCFVKVILAILNVLFLFTGIVLIVVGSWLIASGSVQNLINLSYNGTNSEFFRNAAILLIAMGCVIVVISVIGFVGNCLGNVILLTIYVIFLLIIFSGEIAAGVVAIVFKDRISYYVQNILLTKLQQQLSQNSSSQYYSQRLDSGNGTSCATSDVGYLFDYAQITLKCCGVSTNNSGYGQFSPPTYNFKSMCPLLVRPDLPVSCFAFKNSSTTFGNFHTNPDNEYAAQSLVDFTKPFTSGCSNKIQFWVDYYAPILIGIGIGFGLFELFVLIFAIFVCRNVDSYDDTCSCCACLDCSEACGDCCDTTDLCDCDRAKCDPGCKDCCTCCG